jgi:hypothetical protein
MRRLALLCALTGACYNPDYHENLACPTGLCPPGEHCNAEQVCVKDDTGIDAGIDGGATGCDLTLSPAPFLVIGETSFIAADEQIVVQTDSASVLLSWTGATTGSQTVAVSGGQATLGLEFAEGVTTVTATCGTLTDSHTYTLDTTAPPCEIASPTAGAILTGAADDDPANPDLQWAVSATLPADSIGTAFVLTVNGIDHGGTVVDAAGMGSIWVPLSQLYNDLLEQALQINLTVRDQAGNEAGCARQAFQDDRSCVATGIGGMAGSYTAAGGTTVSPRVDLAGAACAGATVELSGCVPAAASTTAPGPGEVNLGTHTVCVNARCELARVCHVVVTAMNGAVRTSDLPVVTDTRPPQPRVVFPGHPNLCGGRIATSLFDVDATLAGLQIEVGVSTDEPATSILTPPGGGDAFTLNPGDTAVVTLLGPGPLNSIQVQSADAIGNTSAAVECLVVPDSLANVVTLYMVSPDDGASLGPGTVTAGQLAVVLTANLQTSASYSNPHFTIGSTSYPATVSGTTMTASAALDPGTYTVTASIDLAATTRTATAGFHVRIDHPGMGPLSITAATRSAFDVSFLTPGNGGKPLATCFARVADMAGDRLAQIWGVPDDTQVTLRVPGFFPGRADVVGAWCLDETGIGTGSTTSPGAPQLAVAQALGVPAIEGFLAGGMGFGASVATGDLNGDSYPELIVGAPEASPDGEYDDGVVLVYRGVPGGFTPRPWVILETLGLGAHFGAALAVADLDDDGVADLLVGAPGMGAGVAGTVYGYLGSADAAGAWTQPLVTAIAPTPDVTITPAVSWSDGVGFGAALATPDFDQDGVADLLVGAPGIDGGRGGALLIYGPIPSGPSEYPASGSRGVTFSFSTTAAGAGYGTRVADLGRIDPGDAASATVAIAPADAVSGGSAADSEERVFTWDHVAVSLADWPTQDAVSGDELLADWEADDHLGWGRSVAVVGDISGGDMLRDIVVGSPFQGSDAGRISVFAGEPAPIGATTRAADERYDGPAFGSSSEFGVLVASNLHLEDSLNGVGRVGTQIVVADASSLICIEGSPDDAVYTHCVVGPMSGTPGALQWIPDLDRDDRLSDLVWTYLGEQVLVLK